MIRISLIVLTYNHENYISRLLSSIKELMLNPNVEFLFTDDFSEDRTISVIKDQVSDFYNVKVYQTPANLGITKNLLNGLKHAKGEFIMLVSGDDEIINNGFIEKRIQILDSHSDISAVALVTKLKKAENGRFLFLPKSHFRNKRFGLDEVLLGRSISTAGILFRNIFKHENNLKLYEALSNKIKFNDDLILPFILLREGDIYQSTYVGYLQYIYPRTELSNNYNRIIKTEQKLNNEYEALEVISEMLNIKLPLHFRVLMLKEIYFSLITKNNISNFSKIIRAYIKKYKRHTSSNIYINFKALFVSVRAFIIHKYLK